MNHHRPNLLFVGLLALVLAGLLLTGVIHDLAAGVPADKIHGLVTGPLVLVFGIAMIVLCVRLKRMTPEQLSAFNRLMLNAPPPDPTGGRVERMIEKGPPDIG